MAIQGVKLGGIAQYSLNNLREYPKTLEEIPSFFVNILPSTLANLHILLQDDKLQSGGPQICTKPTKLTLREGPGVQPPSPGSLCKKMCPVLEASTPFGTGQISLQLVGVWTCIKIKLLANRTHLFV